MGDFLKWCIPKVSMGFNTHSCSFMPWMICVPVGDYLPPPAPSSPSECVSKTMECCKI